MSLPPRPRPPSAFFSSSLPVALDRPAAAAQLGAQSRIRSTSSFSASQRSSRPTEPSCSARELLARLRLGARRVDADRRLAPDDLQLGLQRLDPLRQSSTSRRHGVLADRHARAGGVEQAHRLVGQLARRDVAVREPDGRLERLVEDLHPVVLLHARPRCPRIIRMPFSSLGSSTWTTWKRRVSAGSFSMYFLYSAQVVAAIVRSVPRARAGLSRFAASPCRRRRRRRSACGPRR